MPDKSNPYNRKSPSSSQGRGLLDHCDAEEPPLSLAGYRRADPVKQFKGRCMLCHTTSVLSLLFKLPPPVETPKFPAEGQGAKILFPLAMGNFPELDVVSYFVCCDACAVHLLRLGTCPTSDTIVGALCLVCLPQNIATILEAVDQAVRGRFDAADLLAILIASLDARLAKNEARDALQIDKNMFREAARWALDVLSSTLVIPAILSPVPNLWLHGPLTANAPDGVHLGRDWRRASAHLSAHRLPRAGDSD